MPLRLRRGTNAERQTITPIEGELIYTTDSKKVYIGDGVTPGGIDIVTATGGSLDSSLNLNTFDITGVGNVNIVGQLNNGKISIRQNVLTTTDTISENGHQIGVLKLGGTLTDVVNPHLQLVRNWENNKSPFEKNYGISNSLDSLNIEYNAYRGTIASKAAIQSGDWIFASKFFGYDGNASIISSLVSYSVDNNASILPGIVPGKMTILTSSSTGGFNTLAFDSRGFLGINKANPTESLDVNGGALFNGTVRATGFIGSIYADDSSLIFNGDTGDITAGDIAGFNIAGTNFVGANINVTNISGSIVTADTLVASGVSIENNFIYPTNTSSSNGHQLGIIQIGGSASDPLEPHCQIIKKWENITVASEIKYSLTTGFSSISEDNYVSRGTIASPSSVQPGDFLSNFRFLAHDGSDYYTTCGLAFSVDSNGSVDPGLVPGKITFTTTSDTGFFHVLSFDSKGHLGVNRFVTTEALDVEGNGLFTGTVTATAFKGTFVGDDSTLIIDGATATINSSSISTSGIKIEDNFITPSNPSTVNGYLFGTLQFGGSPTDSVQPHCQIIRKWDDNLTPFEIRYGTTNGFACSPLDSYSCRGTINSPQAIQPGDFLSNQRYLGFDGTDYITAAAMAFSVDPASTVLPGSVPGRVSWTTTNSTTGFFNIMSFDSLGRLGVNTFNTRETLDVAGNGIFDGTVYASAFSGSIVSNDSLVVFDDDSGALQGSTVTSNGYVMFGSYDAAGRSGLTAANGMVIYNTTVNRFQGYQNGAWINLDDGSAAP